MFNYVISMMNYPEFDDVHMTGLYPTKHRAEF